VTTPRQRWKAWYRQYRIIRREALKAATDVMFFGTGFVMITTEPDYIRHIPVEQIMIRETK